MTEIGDNDKIICDANVYAEINQLKKALAENSQQLMAMETACLQESNRHVELEDSLIAWQDKYERLHESHKRVQKNNQSLEDKLLKLVDRNANERAQLTSDVATLSVRLAQANYNIGTLQREIERYKTDMGLAIQLLQCKPESFVPRKVASLPQEIQTKVSQYVRLDTNSHSDSEGSTSGVGVATENSYHILPASDSPVSSCPFASQSNVYGNGSSKAIGQNADVHIDDQTISPLGMARYLEDKLKAANVKHCDTCSCASRDLRVLADIDQTYSVGVQTTLHGDANHSLCLRCNTNLNSPSSSSSPFLVNLIKSSDSIISEAKSSLSCNGSSDKNIIKRDELTVNPILGHSTIVCDRTKLGTVKKIITAEQIRNNINEATAKQTSPTPPPPLPQQQLHLLKIDESPKGSNQQHRTGIAGSSMSSSSRTSLSGTATNMDGSKIFESFNRNLIKSIKAEKPNISGPRLCALRIPNGSSNILLDNIESESRPVIYTRRSRLLEEELDEHKDIVTTQLHKYLTNDVTVDRCPQKISMLMSDGVKNTNSNSTIDSNSNALGNENENICFENYSTDVCNGIDRKPSNFGPSNEFCHENRYLCDDVTAMKAAQNMIDETDVQHHDETTMLRRQQLSRVAEWVQNNSTLEEQVADYGDSTDALSTPSDYKVNISRMNNGISGCSIDRELRSFSSINRINNNNNMMIMIMNANKKRIDRLSIGSAGSMNANANANETGRKDLAQQNVAMNNLNNNSNSNNQLNGSSSTAVDAAVDLAQMEYNVKQFLLKQNEWSTTGSPSPYESGGRSNGSMTASQLSSNSVRNPHRTETNL